MGYELNKLMKQYGIGTASIAPYTGTEKPVAPTDTSAPDYAQKMADYQQNLAKYNVEYPAYQQYVTDYKNRIANTPQYLDKQFQTKPITMPSQEAQDALKTAAGKFDVTQQQIDDLAKKYSLSNQDIYNVTGSYYGAPLANPSAKKPDYTQDYNALVNAAYGTLGRSPDQAGYDYWVNQLKTGAVDPTKFMATFTAGIQPSDYEAEVKNAYATQGRTGFGSGDKQIDQAGYDYWLNQLKSGAVSPADFMNAFKSGAPAPAAATTTNTTTNTDLISEGAGGDHARGGLIKNYSRGGPEDRGLTALAAGYDVPDVTQKANPEDLPMVFAQSAPTNDAGPNPPAAPAAPARPYSFNAVGPTSAPAVSEPTSGGTINTDKIIELFNKYNKGNDYSTEIKAASEKSKAETDAFKKMLANAMKGGEEGMPSKAEMYFRLAAALGSPTKTKSGFMENVAGAAKEMADYQKSVTDVQRANRAQNLQLAIKGQELGMQSAKEELATLRGLQGEENKDKRQLATEMIKEYIRSGEPQSAAGKQAKDEGFQPGTTAYQDRIKEIVKLSVENKTAELAQKLNAMTVANAQLLLKQQEQAKKEAELTAPEMELKTKTEDSLATTKEALDKLRNAYEESPKAFTNSLDDISQRKRLEATDPSHPRVIATRAMENLLSQEALSKLKATFPGAISDKESEIILKLQGIDAKSRQEREKIIKEAFKTLKIVEKRMEQRLKDVSSGKYKEKTKEGEQ